MLTKTSQLLVSLMLAPLTGFAQVHPVKSDSSYYERYYDKLIVTPYIGNKNTAYTLKTSTGNRLRYYNNSPAFVGLRVGYDFLSLSATVGAGSFDPTYDKAKGKSKVLDLQTTFLTPRLIIDLYFNLGKGVFLHADDAAAFTPQRYLRPDFKTKLIGIGTQYVFNGDKFSARPAFKFDTWQKKSAGSLTAGFDFYYGTAKGDSALVPSPLMKNDEKDDIRRSDFFWLGPNVGYGYSLVLNKHFFATAAVSVAAGASYNKETDIAGHTQIHWRLTPSMDARGGVGYNTENWELSFGYVTNRVFIKGASGDIRYQANNSDFALAYTKRLHTGKRIPQAVGWLGNIIEKAGLGFLIK
ncbi:MAG: DUF4421 family protein [Niabella sp.]